MYVRDTYSHTSGVMLTKFTETVGHPAPLLMATEGDAPRPLPTWARWLVDAGFECIPQPTETFRNRRIVVITTPADSHAAGLIALGALIGQLCHPDANEIHSHFDALLRNARQYAGHCHSCTANCHPERAGCGFLSAAAGRIRKSQTMAAMSILGHGREPSIGDYIEVSARNGSAKLFASSAKDYHIDGSSPYIVATSNGSLSGYMFDAICPQAEILRPNLATSHAGVCLAGRTGGPDFTRSALDGCAFSVGSSSQSLAEMLTVQAWARPGVLSRMTYFNPRTMRLDRPGAPPGVIVADGASTLRIVLSQHEFRNSDVIAILPRTADQDRFEETRDAVANMRQWYDTQPLHTCFSQTPPRGITGIVLCRNS